MLVQIFILSLKQNTAMAKTAKKSAKRAAKKAAKTRGPKDRDYVNKSQKHEVKYAAKRKSPAKKFGTKKSK